MGEGKKSREQGKNEVEGRNSRIAIIISSK